MTKKNIINIKIDNLYQLIYELKEKKGRKLKIMCDWDEVLKSREATVYHIIANRSSPFAEFFQRFWEKVSVEYQGHSCRIISTNLKEVEELREKNPEEFQKRAKEISRTDPSLYEESPWLSITQDLVKALKENLIEHLIITGNYKKNRSVKIANSDDIPGADPRKRKKFQESFGNFPNAKLEINVPICTPQGEIQLSRPEWIKNNHPDFDLFVDDNPNNILGTRTLFSYETNKVYMLPDYKTNQNVQGEHIFRVPVCPTSLKDEDFVYQEKERKENIETQEEYGKEIEKLKKEKEKLEVQMREIANIINPDTDFEFAHLKREIEKLKIISQIRIKELELKKLASFMENELKDDKKAQENLKLFLQGKIKPLKKEVFTMDFRARILEDKLINIGGLQTILDKQKEISCLEEQLVNLQIQDQPQTQIEIPPKNN